MDAPTTPAAQANPQAWISSAHKGEKMMPPTLAPLYAMPSAAGRRTTNHGSIKALIAAAPSAAQLAPLANAAMANCHGVAATAQPNVPSALPSAAQNVTAGMPARRYSRRRLTTASAPARKCSVTMPATHCSGQPVRSTTACRNMGGP